LAQDTRLRRKVLERIALCPGTPFHGQLSRFAKKDVRPVANLLVGRANTRSTLSESYFWLNEHGARINSPELTKRLKTWRTLNSFQICELVYLIHRYGTDRLVAAVASDPDVYKAPGPRFASEAYISQAEIALMGLSGTSLVGPGRSKALLEVLRVIAQQENLTSWHTVWGVVTVSKIKIPSDVTIWPECIALSRRLGDRLRKELRRSSKHQGRANDVIAAISGWADRLEGTLTTTMKKKDKRPTKSKHRAWVTRTTKQPTKRRRKS
jgi:hypothetical protein